MSKNYFGPQTKYGQKKPQKLKLLYIDAYKNKAQ